MKTNSGKRVMSIFAHIVLILLSFMCLFFFAILLINATHSHAELQKGFSIIPGKYFLDNLRSVANDGSFPMFRGIINSVIVSGCSAALCTYFSSLTAYGIYAYDFKESCFYFHHGNPCYADTGNCNGIPETDHKDGNV